VIPVEVTQTPWHYTTFWDWLDHWQTLIAGSLALLAGFGTVVMTRRIANRQIAASREEADRVIAATREQTEATLKQTEAAIRLEELRNASEALAFHSMLEAAMARVLAEAAWARKTYPQDPKTGAFGFDHRPLVRQCITKGAFAELRAACVRQGSPLTGEFLDLEREIDSFASPQPYAGLGDQLTVIEDMARELLRKAAGLGAI
jgi:hypothetical protein